MIYPLYGENVISYDEIPDVTREQALRILENLADQKTGSCVLSGGIGTGRMFLISCLPVVLDRYPMTGFVPEGALYMANTPYQENYDPARELQDYLGQNGLREDTVFVVTSDPKVAVNVNLMVPVVLKMDTMDYEQTYQDGLFTYWPVVDVNNVDVSADDVAASLNIFESTGVSHVPIIERQESIGNFMSAVMSKYSGVWHEFPLGCWVDAYSKAVTVATLRGLGYGADAFSTILTTHAHDFERIFVENVFMVETSAPDVVVSKTTATPQRVETPQQHPTPNTGSKPEHVVFRDLQKVTENLKREVVGQDKPIEQIVGSLAVPAVGVRGEKPLRSFLFMGATGVGKTQTAKLMAEHVMNNPMNFVQIDMSEFGEKHNVSRLIGSPPGYVGSEDPSMLETILTEHPQSLILLDEVEKAHPDVWDVFLQVFQDGRLTTGQGVTLDFSETIIVMTSNLGSDVLSRQPTGFTISGHSTPGVRELDGVLRAHFRPELINRIDTQVVFNNLETTALENIIHQRISEANTQISAQGHKYVIEPLEDDTVQVLIGRLDSRYGARGVHRVVEDAIITPVAQFVLTQPGRKRVQRLRVDMSQDGVTRVEPVTGRAQKTKKAA